MDSAERLRAFVAQNTTRMGPTCRACVLSSDVREAVRQVRAEGTSFSVIAAWLQKEGHNIAAATLARHFREHGGR